MSADERILGAAVEALRELTAAGSDGEATRLRVLAHGARRAGRRILFRRALAAVTVVLVVVTTGSAAWTAIGWWRDHTPPQAELVAAPAAAPRAIWSGRPRRTIPAAPSPVAARADQPFVDRAESDAYGRAHRAHFVVGVPARALAAWDGYLAAYPRGAFAPEARFNRALCLVRLGRWADAARALDPFARGDGYRHEEACTLLAWLREQTDEPLAANSCRAGSR
jgi:hypothetical protein